MIIQREDALESYQTLHRAVLANGVAKVLVIVSTECDSICACRILSDLFKMDHIAYTIRPVVNYEDLKQAIRELIQPGTVTMAVLINCGGTVDLLSFLEIDDTAAENIKLFVFDCHRPYHLRNVNSDNEAIILVDGNVEPELFPDEEDQLDQDERFEEGGTPNSEGRQTKRRRLGKSTNRDYYQGSYYGISASEVMYSLSQQLSRDQNFMLWCALVGLVDQYIHNKVSLQDYRSRVLELRQEVSSKNLDVISSLDGSQIDNTPGAYKDKTIKDGTISFEAFEYEFFLLRHWNLRDAVFHSTYVSTRLGIWTEPGKQQLQSLFAYMGIPLKESHVSYSVMDPTKKTVLNERLRSYAHQCGLDYNRMLYPSFIRNYETHILIGAADVACAITAFLCESSTDLANLKVSQDSFFEAYDAIRKTHLLLRGIQLAIELQKLLVQQGCAILVSRKVTCPGPFRYVILDSPATQQITHPFTLIQLTHFLMEAYKAQSKRSPKPFVLCCFNEEKGTYIVVGLPATAGTNVVNRNTFGDSFVNAAQLSGARIRHDGFDESIVEVQKDDLNRLLNELLLTM